MKIIDSWQAPIPGRIMTVVTFDGEWPRKPWSKVKIGNRIYKPIIPYDAGKDRLGVASDEDFTGKEIEFV